MMPEIDKAPVSAQPPPDNLSYCRPRTPSLASDQTGSITAKCLATWPHNDAFYSRIYAKISRYYVSTTYPCSFIRGQAHSILIHHCRRSDVFESSVPLYGIPVPTCVLQPTLAPIELRRTCRLANSLIPGLRPRDTSVFWKAKELLLPSSGSPFHLLFKLRTPRNFIYNSDGILNHLSVGTGARR